MRVSFLISANAYNRLHAAARDRGWQSDPDYADRTVQRFYSREPRCGLDYQTLVDLAAMSGDFASTTVEEAAAMIGRFFGEPPQRLEIDGAEYAIDPTLARLRSV
jgi:hypothetical protein